MYRLLCLGLLVIFTNPADASTSVTRWGREVVRASNMVWGISGPVPVFLAQIQQESGGRPDVCSPYACGLTQFTPSTAEWIAQTYRTELSATDAHAARFDPRWAIRAMVRYDKHLYDRVQGHTSCDRMWATLRHYNGGAGHWQKEASFAQDPLDRHSVDAQCGKARRSIKHCPENLGYPSRILLRHQVKYVAWGRTFCIVKE